MSRSPNGSSGAPVLPEGVEPCVWMTAGLVAYKLCDRNLDCDHCPFDAALRGAGPNPQDMRSNNGLAAVSEFPPDRWYHPRHGWVMSAADRVARCGIDAFAARLLGHVRSIVLPVAGTHLTQGQAACWCSDDTELYSLAAPISGTVLRNNVRIQDHPDVLCSDPLEDGWLFELQLEVPLEDQNALLAGDAMRELVARQLGTIALTVSQRSRDGRVGPTLQDGGEPAADLRRLLGTKRFRRLVRDWLG